MPFFTRRRSPKRFNIARTGSWRNHRSLAISCEAAAATTGERQLVSPIEPPARSANVFVSTGEGKHRFGLRCRLLPVGEEEAQIALNARPQVIGIEEADHRLGVRYRIAIGPSAAEANVHGASNNQLGYGQPLARPAFNNRAWPTPDVTVGIIVSGTSKAKAPVQQNGRQSFMTFGESRCRRIHHSEADRVQWGPSNLPGSRGGSGCRSCLERGGDARVSCA